MWERPNCCYIGPSTGAADLFLAGNYISSGCRHRGKPPGLLCCCLHQTADISLAQIKPGGYSAIQYLLPACVSRNKNEYDVWALIALTEPRFEALGLVHAHESGPAGAQDHPEPHVVRDGGEGSERVRVGRGERARGVMHIGRATFLTTHQQSSTCG